MTLWTLAAHFQKSQGRLSQLFLVLVFGSVIGQALCNDAVCEASQPTMRRIDLKKSIFALTRTSARFGPLPVRLFRLVGWLNVLILSACHLSSKRLLVPSFHCTYRKQSSKNYYKKSLGISFFEITSNQVIDAVAAISTNHRRYLTVEIDRLSPTAHPISSTTISLLTP